jgi:hypothetical protein
MLDIEDGTVRLRVNPKGFWSTISPCRLRLSTLEGERVSLRDFFDGDDDSLVFEGVVRMFLALELRFFISIMKRELIKLF